MQLFVGFFLDRFNIRFVYAALVALWSAAQMFTGLARGFVSGQGRKGTTPLLSQRRLVEAP